MHLNRDWTMVVPKFVTQALGLKFGTQASGVWDPGFGTEVWDPGFRSLGPRLWD